MMRTNTLSIAVLLLLASLAGCLGNGDASSPAASDRVEPAAEETDAPPEELELVACDEQFTVVHAPASQAEPYLPDGFALTGVPGEPLPEGMATLAVLTLDCDVVGIEERATQLWVHLVVDPPAEYAREDATLQYIPVKWPVNSPTLLDALHAWGLPQASDAEIAFSPGSADPGLASWSTTASDDNGTVHLETETVGNHPPTGGGVVRIFGVADGEVTGAVDFEGTVWEGAAGTATLANDGFIPLDVTRVGAGGLALDYDYVVKGVDFSGD